MSVFKRWNGTSWETIGPQISSARFDDINHMIAPEYSSTSTYNVGDYVVQSDRLYKCNTAIDSSGELWNSAHWTATKVGEDLTDCSRQLSDVEEKLKSALNEESSVVNGILFVATETALTIFGDVATAALSATGGKVADESCIVRRYSLTNVDYVYLKASKDSAGVFQFQNTVTFTSDNTGRIVGETYTDAFDGFLKVPAGATYLFVSMFANNSTNQGKKAIVKYDAEIVRLESSDAELQTKIDDLSDECDLANNTLFIKGDALENYGDADDKELSSTGGAVLNNNAIVRRYKVNNVDYVYLKAAKDSGGVFQFQNETSVTSDNTSRIVGRTHTEAFDGFLKVPSGAKYLMVSMLANNVTNEAKEAILRYDGMIDTLEDRLGYETIAVDLKKLLHYNGTVQSGNGKAYWVGGGQSEDVYIEGAETVSVTASSEANAYICFSKEIGAPVYGIGVTKYVDTPEEYLDRIRINAGTTASYDVPETAKYLCIMRYGTSADVYEPSAVSVTYKQEKVHIYHDYWNQMMIRLMNRCADNIMLRKIVQMRDIEWDSLGTIYSNSGGALVNNGDHIVTGIPYSSVKEKDKYIGFNVSFETFMSATKNPYSVLYTEKCSDSGGIDAHSGYGIDYNGVNCGAYYGQVCNTFVEYVLSMPIPYNTDEFLYLCKMGVFDRTENQSASGCVIGDIVWVPHHTYVVSDIQYASDGALLYVECSEATGAWSATRRMPPEYFESYFLANGGGVIYRYNDRFKNLYYKPLPFIPLWDESQNQIYEYNSDVCTYAGDYAAFFGGHIGSNDQEPIFINCNLGTNVYDTLTVYRVAGVKWKPENSSGWKPSPNDLLTEVATYPLSGMGSLNEIMINGTVTRDGEGKITGVTVNNPLAPGRYVGVLSGTGLDDSAPTHFEIIETNVTITAGESDDTYEIDFSSENGRPLYIQTVKNDGSSLGIYAINQDEIEAGKVIYHPKALYDAQYSINYYGPHEGDVVPSGMTYGTNLNQFPVTIVDEQYVPDYSEVYCKVFFVGGYGTVRNNPIPFSS